ncbi:hypothetical protein SAMN05421493_11817 [Pseudobutyrivibrio sp. 49]|uniref:hypothetical protein n=1 Tax=Pseudobutyrivibrio sp. 49 TaxID=1855344 RepID=UPI00088073DE|nr:hypothetical protein [Pseudobutyrivibrio sp. 49]SDI56173.1 hypothetical protein SAMN05421493_11817 [Pseudobutyrivibrio sp. 49]
MAERVNKFAQKLEQQKGGLNLKDLTNDISDRKSLKTDKRIEDIDIELIDTDDVNEELFGYEDMYKIEQSFDEIGNNSVIYVYTRKGGRYLCYAGNQRLLASKKKGEKKITCVISGPEPTKEERIERLIFMNSQRTPRPYYIAKQLVEYENLLRRKGEKKVTEAIERKFGYKGAMQRRYKQILKIDTNLQDLFKREDIPFVYLLDSCNKIPEGKEKLFIKSFNDLNDGEITTAVIDTILESLTKDSDTKEKQEKKVLPKKTSQVFKAFSSLPYYEDNVTIPEDKKELIAQQAKDLIEYANKVLKACEK